MPVVYKMLTFSNRYKHKQIADKIVCLHCRKYLFLECQCDGIDVRLAYQYQATTSPCIVLYDQAEASREFSAANSQPRMPAANSQFTAEKSSR